MIAQSYHRSINLSMAMMNRLVFHDDDELFIRKESILINVALAASLCMCIHFEI